MRRSSEEELWSCWRLNNGHKISAPQHKESLPGRKQSLPLCTDFFQNKSRRTVYVSASTHQNSDHISSVISEILLIVYKVLYEEVKDLNQNKIIFKCCIFESSL